MKWFAENKFLAVFLAVVLLGAGALGFLLMQAHSSYGDISSQYDEKAKELQRLQSLEPYPNSANLTSTTEVRDGYKAQIEGLLTRMSALALPSRPDLTPNAFQDELRAAVSAATAKAASEGVEIKEPFYLGFDTYQNNLPPAAAAVPLGRDLDVVKMLVDRLINLRAVSINSIKRTALPEETGAATPAATPGQTKGKPSEDKGLQVSVNKHLVNLNFTVKPAAFKQLLNDLAESKQFMVVRTFVVNNSNPTGPSRNIDQFAFDTPQPGADPSATTGAPAGVQPATSPDGGPAAATPGTPGTAEGGRTELVFGDENVEVDILVEILSFTSNTQPAEGATPAATN